MSQQVKLLYEFGPFRVDVANHLLLRKGEVVPLPPKAFDLLLVLVEESGRVLPKDELMSRVWPDSFVEEANLSYNVFTLRKALGEGGDANTYIETIPRRGYRFVAGVTEIANEGTDIVLAEHTRSRVVIEEESETSDVQSQSVELPAASPNVIGRETVAAGRSRWKSTRFMLASAAAAIAIVAAVVYFGSHFASPSDKKKALSMQTIPLTTFPDHEFEPALSPDGKLLAFAWTAGPEATVSTSTSCRPTQGVSRCD